MWECLPGIGANLSTLLINPPYQRAIAGVAQTTVGIPMGLAYLAAALEAASEPVEILDANALAFDVPTTIRRALARPVDVIGLTAVTPTIDLCNDIAQGLRSAGYFGPIVVGGPHPSALPEDTLANYGAFDVVAIGESESYVADLVRALRQGADLGSVTGIAYRRGGEVHRGPACEVYPDLNSLPLPARHLLPLRRYRSPDGAHFLTVVATRGCSAPCNYCSVPGSFGKRIRRRDPARVGAEIAAFAQHHDVAWVYFVDDTFTWDRQWVLELCDVFVELGLSSRIRWQCLTRVDRVSLDIFERMYAAGCRRVEMGIECASPKGLKILNKGIDKQQVVQAFSDARIAGLGTLAFAMMNVPGEGLAELVDTEDLIREIDPDLLQLTICTPYPGTGLYEEARRAATLRTNDWREFRFLRRAVLDNGVLSEQQVLAQHRGMQRRFWMRPRSVLRMARHLLTDRESRSSMVRIAVHSLPRLFRLNR